jgi:hypothetical protein
MQRMAALMIWSRVAALFLACQPLSPGPLGCSAFLVIVDFLVFLFISTSLTEAWLKMIQAT